MKISNKVIPAILEDTVSELEGKLQKIVGLVDWVQIDIADGKFVKNLTPGPKNICNLDLLKKFSVEVHLMVSHPEDYFDDCQKMGAKRVIFHFEAVDDLPATLQATLPFGFEVGVAINPKTKVAEIEPFLSKINHVLVMSVEPGFAGQKFMESVLEKVKDIKGLAPRVVVEVDGGVNLENIKTIAGVGADFCAVGSALFESKDIRQEIIRLNQKIND